MKGQGPSSQYMTNYTLHSSLSASLFLPFSLPPPPLFPSSSLSHYLCLPSPSLSPSLFPCLGRREGCCYIIWRRPGLYVTKFEQLNYDITTQEQGSGACLCLLRHLSACNSEKWESVILELTQLFLNSGGLHQGSIN